MNADQQPPRHARRLLAAGAVLALSGCVPTPTLEAPAPVTLHVARTPSDVVQLAARRLTVGGFEVAVADATGGILTAKRVRGPGGNADVLRCKWPKGSMGDQSAESAYTVSIAAAASGPAGGGSDVTIRSDVLTSYPSLAGGMLAMAPSSTDCVSNGSVETALASVLRDSTAAR